MLLFEKELLEFRRQQSLDQVSYRGKGVTKAEEITITSYIHSSPSSQNGPSHALKHGGDVIPGSLEAIRELLPVLFTRAAFPKLTRIRVPFFHNGLFLAFLGTAILKSREILHNPRWHLPEELGRWVPPSWNVEDFIRFA